MHVILFFTSRNIPQKGKMEKVLGKKDGKKREKDILGRIQFAQSMEMLTITPKLVLLIMFLVYA